MKLCYGVLFVFLCSVVLPLWADDVSLDPSLSSQGEKSVSLEAAKDLGESNSIGLDDNSSGYQDFTEIGDDIPLEDTE